MIESGRPVPRATIIYGIFDPVTRELRYVGKTVDTLARRFDGHLNNARNRAKRPSEFWMMALLKKGIRPEIFEIEICPPGSDWEEAEQFWIEYFRSIGCRLLNLSAGGGAGMLGVKATVEQRRKRSEARKGFRISDETKLKIGAANKGRPHTDKQRRLNSEAKRGVKSPTARLTDRDIPFVRALFAAGYSGTQVGSVFGITKQSADGIRHGVAWSHVPDVVVDISSVVVPPIRRLRGVENGTAKLNEDAVRDIRRRLADKIATGRSLAKEYNVSASIISAVRKRQTWRHVA